RPVFAFVMLVSFQDASLSASSAPELRLMLRLPPFAHSRLMHVAMQSRVPEMLHIFPDAASIAQYVGATLTEKVKSKPEIVLGAATGGTMEPIYASFVTQARQQQLDVSMLTSFNLDEYVGLDAGHP